MNIPSYILPRNIPLESLERSLKIRDVGTSINLNNHKIPKNIADKLKKYDWYTSNYCSATDGDDLLSTLEVKYIMGEGSFLTGVDNFEIVAPGYIMDFSTGSLPRKNNYTTSLPKQQDRTNEDDFEPYGPVHRQSIADNMVATYETLLDSKRNPYPPGTFDVFGESLVIFLDENPEWAPVLEDIDSFAAENPEVMTDNTFGITELATDFLWDHSDEEFGQLHLSSGKSTVDYTESEESRRTPEFNGKELLDGALLTMRLWDQGFAKELEVQFEDEEN